MSRLEQLLWVLAILVVTAFLLVVGVNAYEIHSHGRSVQSALREAALLVCVVFFHAAPGALLGALLYGLASFRLGSRPRRGGAIVAGLLGSLVFTLLGALALDQLASGLADKSGLGALGFMQAAIAVPAVLLILAVLIALGVSAIREARERAEREVGESSE